MTIEVPTMGDAADEGASAASNMVEGALTGAGIEVGGAVVPVVGEGAGGFAASLLLSDNEAKRYANRRAGEEAAKRLLM